VLGEKVSSPLCIAPTAAQRMAHNDGECATSKASLRCGTLMVLSTNSTVSLEEVDSAAPGGLRWFQLYIFTV
jgi:(S)-2-hydroxy-acid oxidase